MFGHDNVIMHHVIMLKYCLKGSQIFSATQYIKLNWIQNEAHAGRKRFSEVFKFSCINVTTINVVEVRTQFMAVLLSASVFSDDCAQILLLTAYRNNLFSYDTNPTWLFNSFRIHAERKRISSLHLN